MRFYTSAEAMEIHEDKLHKFEDESVKKVASWITQRMVQRDVLCIEIRLSRIERMLRKKYLVKKLSSYLDQNGYRVCVFDAKFRWNRKLQVTNWATPKKTS